MRYFGVRVVGNVLPEHARRAALDRARTAITEPELARLVEEQRTSDTYRAGARWMVSLDDVDAYGRPLHELIAA